MRYTLFSLFVFTFVFSACHRTELPPVDAHTNMAGLASGVHLDYGQTEIILADFILDESKIENIAIPSLPDSLYAIQEGKIIVQSVPGMDPVMGLLLSSGGSTECIPLFRSDKQVVEFNFDPGNQSYHNVSARGEFNGWTAGRPEFELAEGGWSGSMLLSPGTYQYLLVADGMDMLDPANPDKIDNNMGGFNSVITVGSGLAEKLPYINTLKFGRGNVVMALNGEVEGVFITWQNKPLSGEYVLMKNGGVCEVRIPDCAREMKRSFIRAWAWNQHGMSNDLLIPLEHGEVLDDPALINRNDHHSMILYNAFVDRFFDGDPTNNRPLDHPDVLPAADYHGGDIKGITRKIQEGYFSKLGINTIWVSPLVKNPDAPYGYWPEPQSKFSGYHGYWPISFTLIDDRYGTDEDLRELVTEAHAKGMNVLLDFVANHVHQDHPVYRDHPDWATDLYLPDGSLNTERWDEYRLTTWFDVFLPTLDLSRPEVYNMLADSALYWIREYDLDGFRHDATKHIPEVFWRALTRKLKEEIVMPEERPVYQIGETYGGPELIAGYVGSGMLDAQFDFNVYDDALAVINKEDQPFSRLAASLQESLTFYGAHNLMGYITGNQDRGRFTSYAGGGLLFDEDAKLAGWTRRVEVGSEAGYERIKLLFAFNMTIPGLPVIYYGDEIGMPGGNDPDSRRMMRFNELNEHERDVLKTVQKLTALRTGNMALMYGDFQSLLLTHDTWAYCRSYFDQLVIVAMNKGDITKNITFDLPERFSDIEFESLFGSLPAHRKGKFSVTLGGQRFDIFIGK